MKVIREHFWETGWFCILMLFMCPWFGLFLMFWYHHFSSFLKVIFTVIMIPFGLFLLMTCSAVTDLSKDSVPESPAAISTPIVIEEQRADSPEKAESREKPDTASILDVIREEEKKKEEVLSTPMSRLSMKDGLMKDGLMSEKEAEKVIEEASPDFSENAYESALIYAESLAMSRNAIYEQLTSEYGENFTPEEAESALLRLDWDWSENARLKALEYAKKGMSEKKVRDILISEWGEMFTEEEADYALSRLEWDWAENAYKRAQELRDACPDISFDAIRTRLTSEEEGFTSEDTDSACSKLGR